VTRSFVWAATGSTLHRQLLSVSRYFFSLRLLPFQHACRCFRLRCNRMFLATSWLRSRGGCFTTLWSGATVLADFWLHFWYRCFRPTILHRYVLLPWISCHIGCFPMIDLLVAVMCNSAWLICNQLSLRFYATLHYWLYWSRFDHNYWSPACTTFLFI
jgi:hypothetical protein